MIDKYFKAPEPKTEPPETPSVIIDCGHDVYGYEEVFEWPEYNSKSKTCKVKLICGDCFEEKAHELSAVKLADLLGWKHRKLSELMRRE